MKKILPLETPVIKGFPTTSTILSILQTHKEIWPWILNNFIQVFGSGLNTNIDFFDINIDSCPFLVTTTIDKNLIGNNRKIIEFITLSIDYGNYITCIVDTAKISSYGGIQYYHDPLIYGYDSEKEEIYFVEYLANGVYTKTSCSYIELENAIVLGNLDNIDQIERFEQDYTTIKLIKYDDTWFNYKIELRNEYENRFSFIPERVYQSFNDYVNGFVTLNWFTRIPYINKWEKDNHCFGIECYHLMKLQLEKNWELKVMVKGMRQSFYVMYSQKIMQCQRIKYMMLNGYLNNADLHLKAWEYIADKMHIILQLLLKENIKNKFDVAMKYKIISELDALREYEMERIHSFLRDIVLTG